MPEYLTDDQRARLEINARSFRPDPFLERACELWDTDREAFNRLPRSAINQHDIYRDLRQHYRDAVKARVITDQPGPSAA